MRDTQTILVAEEHPATRSFLADNLAADGYEVLSAEDRSKAMALLDARPSDLVVVDVNRDTRELLDAVRSGNGLAARIDPDTPMILLTGDANTLQRIRMLERGGDDVLAKPFSYPELRARIGAVLRRADAHGKPRLIRVGPLAIDATSRTVTAGESLIELSAKEYELLLALAQEPARAFTREELLRDVCGFRCHARTRTLDSHASRLRRKLREHGAGALVINVWGVGYGLCDAALVG